MSEHGGAVEPALTSEEWRGEEYSDGERGWDVGEDGAELYRKADGGFHIGVLSSGLTHEVNPHALAALCLHGHPAGFTWADVDALMESPPDEPKLTEIAARIAALLPPRESP